MAEPKGMAMLLVVHLILYAGKKQELSNEKSLYSYQQPRRVVASVFSGFGLGAHERSEI